MKVANGDEGTDRGDHRASKTCDPWIDKRDFVLSTFRRNRIRVESLIQPSIQLTLQSFSFGESLET